MFEKKTAIIHITLACGEHCMIRSKGFHKVQIWGKVSHILQPSFKFEWVLTIKYRVNTRNVVIVFMLIRIESTGSNLFWQNKFEPVDSIRVGPIWRNVWVLNMFATNYETYLSFRRVLKRF